MRWWATYPIAVFLTGCMLPEAVRIQTLNAAVKPYCGDHLARWNFSKPDQFSNVFISGRIAQGSKGFDGLAVDEKSTDFNATSLEIGMAKLLFYKTNIKSVDIYLPKGTYLSNINTPESGVYTLQIKSYKEAKCDLDFEDSGVALIPKNSEFRSGSSPASHINYCITYKYSGSFNIKKYAYVVYFDEKLNTPIFGVTRDAYVLMSKRGVEAVSAQYITRTGALPANRICEGEYTVFDLLGDEFGKFGPDNY